ncbi:hypothetical protein GH714_006628 [Hevea brasiliensis]|uniref:Protein kinase domain-containing protein n=1 Tax=Hevea brasiliensis TaxID=3981 RepID=A0A6A6M505_HEVBR|nr:hypothetical protein GH714_006628 [Hevea brasiliensis]
MSKSKNFFQNLIKPFKLSSSRKGKSEEDLDQIAAQEQKQFAFDTLVFATKDFHPTHKLGEGGFGPVYRGKLADGREIAVKKLSHSSKQGKKEFMNEAKLLARVQHRNVVNLLGYCAHGTQKLLVYEYVANESLDKFIFKPNRRELLDWKRSSYMAPEYVMRGHLSVKADIFSFGVVVLELISGQRNSTFSQSVEAQNLLDWAYKLHKKDRSLELMDPTLTSSADNGQVKMCIHIGLLCVQGDPQLRPNMRRVVIMLSKKPGNLEEPTRPLVTGSRYRRSHQPPGMSSTAGTFSDSDSRTFDSSLNTNTATASSSTRTSPRLDPHGKRPMES